MKIKKKIKIKTKKDICTDLWSEVVKKRAGNKCEKCGKITYVQSHHIIPRTNWALKFDLANGVALCDRCHIFWAHKDAIGFANWLMNKYGAARLHYLDLKRHNQSRNDYGAIEIYLRNELKKLGDQA